MRLVRMALLLVLLWPAHAMAVQPDEMLKDPRLEQRARDISTGLRCLVCQNQSIDDSNAPLAKDLRVLVRERLKAGDSNEEVLKFVVARYGEFILLKPPFNIRTLLLWILPGMILLLAGGVILFNMRRRRAAPVTAQPLNETELSDLRRILDDKQP